MYGNLMNAEVELSSTGLQTISRSNSRLRSCGKNSRFGNGWFAPPTVATRAVSYAQILLLRPEFTKSNA